VASSSLIRGYAYTNCRLLGHMWLIVPSDWTPSFGVPMTVRCERCNIERRDTLGRNTGHVESRRYTYPAGYNFSHADNDGADLPRRDDFRLAWLEGIITESRKSRGIAREHKERVPG